MDRTYRIVVTLISFLLIFTSALSNATVHHTGATLGQFEVGGSGEANYTVPLAIPPGIAGMQPSLSLAYSSQGGNGTLGMGWALSGLSAVHRCGGTIAQDGRNSGVNYTTEDKLCIDGQRLVAVNGVYGADGTEYRTEKDSWSKIISHGAIASGPQWFEVKTKGGQIMEYGNTTDSAIEAEGKTDIRLWAVNKISDTVGNYLTFTYTEVNNITDSIFEYYPDRIDYTGNDTAVLSMFAHIKFVYEDRTDKTPIYMGGSKITSTKRLKTIQTFINETTKVREYQLAYENTGSQSLSKLISLTECSADAICKPATTFDWQDSSGDLSPGPTSQWAELIPDELVSWMETKSHWLADINGNGKKDLVYVDNNNGDLYIAFSNGVDGFGTPQPSGNLANHNYKDNVYTWAADVNGDGKDDLVIGKSDNTYYLPHFVYVLLSDGQQLQAGTKWADLNFGLPETTATRWTVTAGDVDGDDLDDLVILRDDGSYLVGRSTGTAFGAFENWHTGGVYESYTIAYRPPLSDVNGDGLDDLIVASSNRNVYVYLSNGDSFSSGKIWYTADGFSPGGPVAGDVNGDGLSDLIIGTTLLISDGNEFKYAGAWSSTSYLSDGGDIDGDGNSDSTHQDYWPLKVTLTQKSTPISSPPSPMVSVTPPPSATNP